MSVILIPYDTPSAAPVWPQSDIASLPTISPEDEPVRIEQPGLLRRILDALQSDRAMVPVPAALPEAPEVRVAKRILVMIPAHNESQGIRDCLEGLADQLSDFRDTDTDIDVLLIADNCSDNTERIAADAGRELGLRLAVFRTKGNTERKVGALNAAWAYIYGNALDQDLNDTEPTPEQLAYRGSVKAILGMDADSRLAPGALKALWDELMESRDIGGVMARYTMRLPVSKNTIERDDPHYEQKLASGRYGGAAARWWVSMQKQDMASWLVGLQHRGGSTYVLGGQASLFRPQALADIVNSYMTLGPWDPSTQVEDMKLTWRLQEMNRRTLVSRKARCYVDAMRSYHTLMAQRLKWDGGLVGLLTDKNGQAKSRHTGFLWRQQAKMALDAFTRILFFLLVAVALMSDQYKWNWLWVIPPVVASALNIRLALRVPQHRPVDVFLAGTLISPELYLWVRLLVWVKVWSRKLSVQERDGWESQYAAQRGDTKSRLGQAIAAIVAVGGAAAWLCIHFRAQLTGTSVQHATKFDLQVGFVVLTGLAIAQTLAMLRQHWMLRSDARG